MPGVAAALSYPPRLACVVCDWSEAARLLRMARFAVPASSSCACRAPTCGASRKVGVGGGGEVGGWGGGGGAAPCALSSLQHDMPAISRQRRR